MSARYDLNLVAKLARSLFNSKSNKAKLHRRICHGSDKKQCAQAPRDRLCAYKNGRCMTKAESVDVRPIARYLIRKYGIKLGTVATNWFVKKVVQLGSDGVIDGPTWDIIIFGETFDRLSMDASGQWDVTSVQGTGVCEDLAKLSNTKIDWGKIGGKAIKFRGNIVWVLRYALAAAEAAVTQCSGTRRSRRRRRRRSKSRLRSRRRSRKRKLY